MSNDFYGLANAIGLSPEQRATIQRLLEVRRKVTGRNELLRAYYEGSVRVKDFGITIESERLENDKVCFWPEKAVTSLAERERFDGFVFEDQHTEDALEDAVTANRLVTAYRRYNNSKLMHGVMFACVNSVHGLPQVRFHSAETAWAEPDGNYDSGKIGAGIAVARAGRKKWTGKRVVPTQVNFYERGRVTVLELVDRNKWAAQVHELPHDECMMYAFVHKSTGTKPFGQSRITKTVMSLTRDAIRTSWHMTLSGAFYAMPKYIALGLTDAQFNAMKDSKPKFYMDSMMLFTRDKQGNVPDIQQFSGNTPDPFIAELKYYASQFSGATGVPLSSLGVNADQPTSSEAMAAARNELIAAAQDDIDADSATLREVALMMMAVAGNTTIDALTDEQRTVQAHFLAPEMPSASSTADAAMKIASSIPWVTDTDWFLEQIGMEQADIMRVRRARDAYSSAQSLNALFEQVGRAEQVEEVE